MAKKKLEETGVLPVTFFGDVVAAQAPGLITYEYKYGDKTVEVKCKHSLTYNEKSAFVRQGKTNWAAACPPPSPGQKSELWDLMLFSGEAYMVITSTVVEEGRTLQIHQLIDASVYMALYRDMSRYSKDLRDEKESHMVQKCYDRCTGE